MALLPKCPLGGPLPEATPTEFDRRIWSDYVGFWFLVNLVGLCQIWSDLVVLGRIQSDLVGFGRIRSDSVGVAPGRGPTGPKTW